MKHFLYVLLLLFIGFFSNASAQPRNDLKGIYAGNSKYTYNRIELFGNGKSVINKEIPAEYYHENDSLFVFVDMNVSIYLIEKRNIKGITKWQKNENLKLISKAEKNDEITFEPSQRANWLKRFYLNNSQSKLSKLMDDGLLPLHFEQINLENKLLCDEGFDLGCIQNFSYLTLQLLNHDYQTVDKNAIEFDQLKNIAQRVIDLNNPDGYGLMYSYYVMKDEEKKGEEYLDKGMSEGSQLCLKLSLDKFSLSQ